MAEDLSGAVKHREPHPDVRLRCAGCRLLARLDMGEAAIDLLRRGAVRPGEARAWNFRHWQEEAQAFVDAAGGPAF